MNLLRDWYFFHKSRFQSGQNKTIIAVMARQRAQTWRFVFVLRMPDLSSGEDVRLICRAILDTALNQRAIRGIKQSSFSYSIPEVVEDKCLATICGYLHTTEQHFQTAVQGWISDERIGEMIWTPVCPGKNSDWRHHDRIKDIVDACDGGARCLEQWITAGGERSNEVWRGGRHKKVPAPADVSVEGAATAARPRGWPRAPLQTVDSDSPGQAAVRARLHRFTSPLLNVLCAELSLKIPMRAPKDQKVELLMTKHEDLQRAWESTATGAAAAAASPAAAAAAAAGASSPAAASAAVALLPPLAARDSDLVTQPTPMPHTPVTPLADAQLRPTPPSSLLDPAPPADPATASAVRRAQLFLAKGGEHRIRRRWGEACTSFTAGLAVLGVGARIDIGAATEEELSLDTQLRIDWAWAALRECKERCTAALEDSQGSKNKNEIAARQSAELAREVVEHCTTVMKRGPSSELRTAGLSSYARWPVRSWLQSQESFTKFRRLELPPQRRRQQ